MCKIVILHSFMVTKALFIFFFKNIVNVAIFFSKQVLFCFRCCPLFSLFFLVRFEDLLGAELLVLLIRAKNLVPPCERRRIVAHKVVVMEVMESGTSIEREEMKDVEPR